MLDKTDLQAIQTMLDASIAASEERLKAYVDSSVSTSIAASEERLKTYVDTSVTASEARLKTYVDSSVTASEERMTAKMDAMENRWFAFYEAKIEPQFQLLAEGHQTLMDTLAPKARVDALEDEIIFVKSVLKAMSQEIAELKAAQ